MTRRKLLEASLVSSILHAGLAEGATGTSGVVVGNGVDRWGARMAPSGYPSVKISTRDTGGAWSAFESPVSAQAGVPLHVHHRQEEWFYVLEGKFAGESTAKILILCQPVEWMQECSAAIARMP